MKGFIKIGLIALAAIIVGILIFVFIGVIDTLPPTTIAPKDFTATVENRIRQEITGKPFSEARTAFDNLNGFIATESFATLTTGEKALSESDAQQCRQLVFNAYAPIFVEYGNGYFQQSSWNESEIALIGAEAQRLTSLNLAEASDASTFNNFVQYASRYSEAKSTIRRASSVKTTSAAQSIIKKAKDLNVPPLSNNTELKQGLEGVSRAAKNSVLKDLQKRSNDLHSRADYITQSTYGDWNREYESLTSEIESYARAFSDNSLSSDVETLSRDDARILSRITSQEQGPNYE